MANNGWAVFLSLGRFSSALTLNNFLVVMCILRSINIMYYITQYTLESVHIVLHNYVFIFMYKRKYRCDYKYICTTWIVYVELYHVITRVKITHNIHFLLFTRLCSRICICICTWICNHLLHISHNSIANKILLLTVPRRHSVYRSHIQIRCIF